MQIKKWSLFDAVAMFVCLLLMAALLAPQLQRRREQARADQCMNNLKQLGLAIHNYHAAFNQLPPGSGGTNVGSEDEPLLGNANRLSAWVPLSPFYEQQSLWEKLSNPFEQDGVAYPPMGPVPWYDPTAYKPWGERPKTLVCPSDPDAARFPVAASYVVNYGDGIFDVGAPEFRDLPPYARDSTAKRGVFKRESRVRFADITDGLAITVMYSEAKIAGLKVARNVAGLPLNPSLCMDAQKDPAVVFWPEGREACWADGSLRSTGFQTVLIPNSPSATSEKGELEGVMSVSSHHPDGVHVCFSDGAVRFISNSIDAGDSHSPSVAEPRVNAAAYAFPGSPSPYGLWGALGTCNGKEPVDPKQLAIRYPVIEYSADELAKLQELPLESWTLKAVNTEFKARLVNVQRKRTATLLTESGAFKNVRLTELIDADAARALEVTQQRTSEKLNELVTRLERGLHLLETKKFEEFATDFLPANLVNGNDKTEVAQHVAKERGRLIMMLDSGLRRLKSSPPSPQIQIDDTGTEVRIPLDVDPTPVPAIKLESVNGIWRLSM